MDTFNIQDNLRGNFSNNKNTKMMYGNIYDTIRGNQVSNENPSKSLVDGIEDELFKLQIKSKELEYVYKQSSNARKRVVQRSDLDQDVDGKNADLHELRNLRMHVNKLTFDAEKKYSLYKSREQQQSNILGSYGTEMDEIKNQRSLNSKMRK